MTRPETSATITDAMVTAAAEAMEDAALTHLGRDFGTGHRDDIARAALTAALSVAEPGCSGAFQSAAAAHRRAETRCADLASELDRLREAAQAVSAFFDAWEWIDEGAYDVLDALRAVLESDGAPADRPAATEDER